jgi:hypothetical protein
MKNKMMKWLARGAFVTLVAGAMLVAGPRYVMAEDCQEPWQMGYCPPMTLQECIDDCNEIFGNGGICAPGPCCNCFL